MAKKYDAVVIGAGLGGMSAATYMAKNDLSICLLERHNIPGGYATSFVRGRYEFEIALHELSGIGPPEHRGELYRYLEYIGVADRVEFLQVPEMYRSVFPDLDVTMPVGRDAYESKMCETFPHERDNIHRFLGRVDAVSKEIGQITRQRGIGNPLTAPMRYPNAIRYMAATWGEVLNRDVKGKTARAVLSQYWGYFGLPPSKISFMYFAMALSAYMKLGPSFINGRSQKLSNAFIDSFIENGGEVFFNSGVEKITTSGDKVTGVICEDGTEIQADHVVSNADPITTGRMLLDPGVAPNEFFTRLRPRTIAPSTLNVYMGINRSPEELGLSNHENFINADEDFDRHGEMMGQIGTPPITLASCYNAVCPDISPPGTTCLVLTTLFYGAPWYDVPPDEYVATKNRVADAMIETAGAIAPDIRKYAEVVEVSTPITNMRYAGSQGGSIYGFNNPPWDHSVLRMSHKGPVHGLSFAGAWTIPGGGFEPCMFSGQMAADPIVRKVKKSRKEA